MGYWDTAIWAYGRAPLGPRQPPDILPDDCFELAYAHIYICARAGWPRRLAAPAGRAMGAIDHNPSYISAYRPLAMLGAPAGWPLAALGTHHFA